MNFKCTLNNEFWYGNITSLKDYGKHFEIFIQSRSSIMVIVGKTSRGLFACMPDYETGCHLVNLSDKYWNTERLSEVLGKIDGITVANALFSITEKVENLLN
jgi:hypothetical protein